jgi:hypothetical protein
MITMCVRDPDCIEIVEGESPAKKGIGTRLPGIEKDASAIRMEEDAGLETSRSATAMPCPEESDRRHAQSATPTMGVLASE